MKAAVIGVGVGGIAALRRLAVTPEISHVVAYEQGKELGGTWTYTDSVGEDENGRRIHPSCYKNCFTNDTIEMVTFPDLPQNNDLPPGSFVPREKMLSYLNYYVDHFDLRKYIQVNSEVVTVDPVTEADGRVEWHVEVRRLDDPQKPTEKAVYDSVFVCNGQDSVPLVPDIPGLGDFKGTKITSHDYRGPEMFKGQTVMCVGGGPSGLDMGMLISAVAKEVYLSQRNPLLTSDSIFPANEKQVPVIKLVKEHSVVLENGEELEIDSMVLCAGYRYSFPFLSERCRPKIKDEEMKPLFKHIIHAEFPSLFFIGMAKFVNFVRVSPFQAQFAVATLLGKIPLPSKEEMIKDIDEDHTTRITQGFHPLSVHTLFPAMQYFKPVYESIMAMPNAKDHINVYPEVYMAHVDHEMCCYFADPLHYRDRRYPLDADWGNLPGDEKYPLIMIDQTKIMEHPEKLKK